MNNLYWGSLCIGDPFVLNNLYWGSLCIGDAFVLNNLNFYEQFEFV
jgi:hypothetical protein